MPWLQVNILAGEDQSVIEDLMLSLSEETARVLRVPLAAVRVLINEYETERWAVGGAPIVPVYDSPRLAPN
jgi:4-oxalocrotonate tautomerase family enzyme